MSLEAMRKIVGDMQSIKACDYYDMAQDWAARIQAEIERMDKAEPVAWLRYASDGTPIDALIGAEPIPFLHGRNAKLYTHPPADAGMVMVPRNPTIEMVEAFYRAYDRPLSPHRWETKFDNAWEALIAAAEGK